MDERSRPHMAVRSEDQKHYHANRKRLCANWLLHEKVALVQYMKVLWAIRVPYLLAHPSVDKVAGRRHIVRCARAVVPPPDRVRVMRHFEDGHQETWWALERRAGPTRPASCARRTRRRQRPLRGCTSTACP